MITGILDSFLFKLGEKQKITACIDKDGLLTPFETTFYYENLPLAVENSSTPIQCEQEGKENFVITLIHNIRHICHLLSGIILFNHIYKRMCNLSF